MGVCHKNIYDLQGGGGFDPPPHQGVHVPPHHCVLVRDPVQKQGHFQFRSSMYPFIVCFFWIRDIITIFLVEASSNKKTLTRIFLLNYF